MSLLRHNLTRNRFIYGMVLCLTCAVPAYTIHAQTPPIAAPANIAAPPASGEPEFDNKAFENKPTAILQTLDKITARVAEIKTTVGNEVTIGALKIIVRACKKSPPLEPPEAAAFIQITEQKPGSKLMDAVFSGWMFASSPALSAMEHPVYDIWVKDCL